MRVKRLRKWKWGSAYKVVSPHGPTHLSTFSQVKPSQKIKDELKLELKVKEKQNYNQRWNQQHSPCLSWLVTRGFIDFLGFIYSFKHQLVKVFLPHSFHFQVITLVITPFLTIPLLPTLILNTGLKTTGLIFQTLRTTHGQHCGPRRELY